MTKTRESIYRRKDGRWEGRYLKGRTPEGKAIYGSVYDKKYPKVKEKLAQAKAKLAFDAAGSYSVKGSRSTLSSWFSYWLEGIKKPIIKPVTYTQYQRIIKWYIEEPLGQKTLASLSTEDIQQFVNGLIEKSLSPSSIRTIFAILKSALKHAVRAKVIDENPCEDVELPQVERKAVSALTKEEHNSELLGAASIKTTLDIDADSLERKRKITDLVGEDFLKAYTEYLRKTNSNSIG